MPKGSPYKIKVFFKTIAHRIEDSWPSVQTKTIMSVHWGSYIHAAYCRKLNFSRKLIFRDVKLVFLFQTNFSLYLAKFISLWKAIVFHNFFLFKCYFKNDVYYEKLQLPVGIWILATMAFYYLPYSTIPDVFLKVTSGITICWVSTCFIINDCGHVCRAYNIFNTRSDAYSTKSWKFNQGVGNLISFYETTRIYVVSI